VLKQQLKHFFLSDSWSDQDKFIKNQAFELLFISSWKC